MDIDSLYEKFLAAKNSDEISECVIEAVKIVKNLPSEVPPKLYEIYLHLEILLYQAMKMLHQKNYDQAEFLVYTVIDAVGQIPQGFFHWYYLLGRVNYTNGNYERAAKCFGMYNTLKMEHFGDLDELGLFYRANSIVMTGGDIQEAESLYKKILEVKSDFPEVQHNLEVLQKNSTENLITEVSSLWNFCDYQDIPIFINARDRVGVMKKLIDWLLDAGYRNLIILDNNSTYKKLLQYYRELEKDSRVKIIRLKKNLGYKAIWYSNILEELKISTPYIYTDPDVVPAENCPKDFVKQLCKILDDNHEIRKVGLGLIYDDITFFGKKEIYEQEHELHKSNAVDENLSYAQVDTTFALYSNLRSYSLRFSLRTYGNYVARHLPWYFNYNHLPEDEKYYMNHAKKSFITSVKDKVSGRS